MTRTGVFTAVERKRAGPALGWAMFLTLLMGSGASAAMLLNPSFEATHHGIPYERLLPDNWRNQDGPSFYWYCYNLWHTDGTWSVALFSQKKLPITRGTYQSIFQEDYVDLTGIGTIKFDVELTSSVPFEHFEASFLVDRVPLWSQRVGGVYLDQEVNVAGMVGRHRIEMRITALDTGTFGATYWTVWDNLRLIEGQLTIPAVVDLDPNTLNLASNGNWITCYIELGQDESGKIYDVSTIDGATVALKCGDRSVPAYIGNQGWATAAANTDNVADFDGDGILERMVKFDRAAVQALVQPPEATTVLIQGKLAGGTLASSKLINGISLEGKAAIRVLDNKAQKP